MMSETQGDDPFDLGFSVLLRKWDVVYPTISLTTRQLPAIEQKHRDEAMSDAFLKYFGAWAILHLTHHRQFIGLLAELKPPGNEHVSTQIMPLCKTKTKQVRWMRCKAFVDKDISRAKIREQRSRSRDLSLKRDGDSAEPPSRSTSERPRDRQGISRPLDLEK